MAKFGYQLTGYPEVNGHCPPPFFPRSALNSVPRNKLPKGSKSQFLGVSFSKFYLHAMYIFTYLLILGLGGGPVGQPPLALNEKALYLPKPHPSNKIV